MPAKRILLVEDDRELAGILRTVLGGEGYAVDVADTVVQGWRRLESIEYALVIADLRLPDGNGLEIAERAAELGCKTALMSGYLHQLEPAAADRHEVMVKPMRPVEVIAVVRRLIG